LNKLALAAIALIAFATAEPICARATVVTQTFSDTQTTFANATGANTYELESFDTALGTLTGVTLSFSVTTTAEAVVLDLSAKATAYKNATASFTFTMSGPGGAVVTDIATAGPASGTTTARVLSQTVAATKTTTTSNSVAVSSFAAYETSSTGEISVVVDSAGVMGKYSGSGSGVAFGGAFTGDGGTETVTYTYTAYTAPPPVGGGLRTGTGSSGLGPSVSHGGSAVPEPATMSIFCLGLLGMCAARRRV